MSDKPAEIAALKAEIAAAEAAHRAAQQERLDKLLRLSREFVAEGLPTAADREFFMGLSKPLTKREHSHTVNSSMMTAVHKVAISAGRKKKDAFLNAVRAKGLTMRGLAAELDIPPSLISMYRSAEDPRPIPRERAERIQALTGWPADARHWPGGIA